MMRWNSFLFFFLLLVVGGLRAEVTVYLGENGIDGQPVQLSLENLTDPKFPQPRHSLPVLFVHGDGSGSGKSYQRDWQQSFNAMPSFKETLALPGNSWLGIEPYYLDLEDYRDEPEKNNRSLAEDAAKIKEAVELVLLHQGDPGAKEKKVVIIANGRGAISTRFYLKDLWERQDRRLAFQPVSEFIAISPPNHGINSPGDFMGPLSRDNLALQQLCNGYTENCRQFPRRESHDFIEKLNGHPLSDTMPGNYCASIFDTEAPGSRRDNETPDKGILYVTLFARGDRDIMGGSEPSSDCRGRVLARNLAPNAENREVPGILGHPSYPEIPGGEDKMAVYRYTVHMPEVICKALYTAVYHQAPPDELAFTASGNERQSPPLIPPLQQTPQKLGLVMLFDISSSMSWDDKGNQGSVEDDWPLTGIKKAAVPFLQLLADNRGRQANLGIAVFPALPWNCELQKDGCAQTVNPMAPVNDANNHNAAKTIHCLSSQGYTPLLKGIVTARHMFSGEKRKVIIISSDGRHNFPGPLHPFNPAVTDCIKGLAEEQIEVYTVAGGSNSGDPALLRTLAIKSFDQTFSKGGWQPQPIKEDTRAACLSAAYMSIFSDVLDLEEGGAVTGTIKAGETVTVPLPVEESDREITFLLSWTTPQQGRLELTVVPPGSTLLQEGEGVKIHRGDVYHMITKSFLGIQPNGTGNLLEHGTIKSFGKVRETFLQKGSLVAEGWNVSITAPGLKKGEEENFRYAVVMDTGLKMDAGFDKNVYETGDTVTLTAAVTKESQPVTGLTDVSVSIESPREGWGNWHAQHKISAAELETIPDTIDEEFLTQVQRKEIFLARQGKTAPAVLNPESSPTVLPLYDDGTHGDNKRDDGIYTNQFTDTVKQGTYSFRFRAVGDTFVREKFRQKYIDVAPQPGHSSLAIQLTDLDDDPHQYSYDVQLVPKDRLGSVLGPGHRVEVEVVYRDENAGTQAFILPDLLGGMYRGPVTISRFGLKTGTRLVFTIDGKPFTTVERIPVFKSRWVGGYVGLGIPGFSFKKVHKLDIAGGLQLGYQLSPQYALVGQVGYNHFKARPGPEGYKAQWWHIALGLRPGIFKTPYRFYVETGPGLYFSGEGAAKPGFNLGIGAAYSLKSAWNIEVGGVFHHVFSSGVPDPNFFVTYTRLAFRF